MNSRKNRPSFFVIITFLFSIQAACAAADRIYISGDVVRVSGMMPQRTVNVLPVGSDYTIAVDKNGFPSEKDMLQLISILEYPYLWYFAMSNTLDLSLVQEKMDEIKHDLTRSFEVLYEAMPKYNRYKASNPEKGRLLKSIIHTYRNIIRHFNGLFYMRHCVYDCKVRTQGEVIDIPFEMHKKAEGEAFRYAHQLYRMFNNAMAQFFIKENCMSSQALVTKISSLFLVPDTCLGFCKHGDQFYAFANNVQKVLSEIFIGDDVLILTTKGEPLQNNGFLISQRRGLGNHFSEVSNIFDIDYIEGALSVYPFKTQKIMSVPLHLDKDQLSKIADIVDDSGDLLMGFLALPTTSYEVQVNTIAFMEYLEEEIQNGSIAGEGLMLLHEHGESMIGSMLQHSSDTCLQEDCEISVDFISDEIVKKKVLHVVVRAKEKYRETIVLSEYEKAIEAEQRARSIAVAQGTTQSAKSNNKSKKRNQSKKIEKQVSHKGTGKASGPSIDKQKIAKEVQSLLDSNVSGARVKLRHMIKIINAIDKKYAIDGVNVRVNGSHCNFDTGEGKTPSFVLPHGKKEGVSLSVADTFFNQLVKAVALLNLKG